MTFEQLLAILKEQGVPVTDEQIAAMKAQADQADAPPAGMDKGAPGTDEGQAAWQRWFLKMGIPNMAQQANSLGGASGQASKKSTDVEPPEWAKAMMEKVTGLETQLQTKEKIELNNKVKSTLKELVESGRIPASDGAYSDNDVNKSKYQINLEQNYDAWSEHLNSLPANPALNKPKPEQPKPGEQTEAPRANLGDLGAYVSPEMQQHMNY